MQRSRSLPVLVHCAHRGRTVQAVRNAAIDRLVSCAEAEPCRAEVARDPRAPAGAAFPHGCAVYPSLALAR